MDLVEIWRGSEEMKLLLKTLEDLEGDRKNCYVL